MTEATTETTTKPSVEEAWSAVMGEVTHLGKDSRNAQQGFNFRGIDALMNLVGPVLRKHGVAVIPEARKREGRDITTKNGTVMHEVAVEVNYLIIGPRGDTLSGSSFGEASDAGDKATPKAMSVAMRTFLLQALCLPTDEPDPDAQTHDRGVAAPEQASADKTAAGLLAADDAEKVRGVKTWAEGKGLLDYMVNDGQGNSIALSRLFDATLARLGDTTAETEAEKVLAESLGATKVSEEPAGAPTEEPPA